MKNFLNKIFKKKVSPEEFLYNPALRKELLPDPNVKKYINRLWEIEVKHKGQTLVKMPFFFMVHTHLKDYGFDKNLQSEETPIVIFRTSEKGEAKIPLFTKKP